LDLLEEMGDRGVKPNEVTYSILLDLLAEAGQWQRALYLFTTLEQQGEPPGQATPWVEPDASERS
jgi:pentatricopeptide repeat protein